MDRTGLLLPGDTVWTRFNEGPYVIVEHKLDNLVVDAHVAKPEKRSSKTARHSVSRTSLVRDKCGEYHIIPRDILVKRRQVNRITGNRLTLLDYVVLCAAAGGAASITQIVVNILGVY